MDYDVTDSDRIPNLEDTLPLEVNPDQRTPCVLVLDTSYSMSGAPISELNKGLVTFKQALMEDPLAQRRVEVAVLTFGEKVEVVQNFITAQAFEPPRLTARGRTPMGEAINRALDGVARLKTVYRDNGIPYTRPWVFLITDGAPTDEWQGAAERVHRDSAAGHVVFFVVGVQRADMRVLGRIAPPDRSPKRLDGLKFRELFEWLSVSLGSASRSAPGQQVPLTPTQGWDCA